MHTMNKSVKPLGERGKTVRNTTRESAHGVLLKLNEITILSIFLMGCRLVANCPSGFKICNMCIIDIFTHGIK